MQDAKVIELTQYINLLVQEFLTITQTLNDAYTGVSKQELNIISIVGRREGAIMREIAEDAQLAVSSVTPIIDKLVEKKLVKRERSDEDRRIVSVALTDKGAKVYQMEVEAYMRLSAGILQALSASEQDKFLGYFRKVASSFTEKKAIAA